MLNFKTFGTLGIFLTVTSEAVLAMPPQESDVKACKAITNDKDRLKCFDRLFGETSKPQSLPEEARANWKIEETKSPDGSPQLQSFWRTLDSGPSFPQKALRWSLGTLQWDWAT